MKLALCESVLQEIDNPSLPVRGLTVQPALQASVRVWDNVLTQESFEALSDLLNNLGGRYESGSFWCPADASTDEWRHFFSIFYELLGDDRPAGVEWWVRRTLVNTSKNFHFDKDEQLARTTGQLSCPLHATVLYLSSSGGPTVIANQIANDSGELVPTVPVELAVVECAPNRFMEFPGNLSHGVLGREGVDLRTTLLMNWWQSKPLDLERTPSWIEFPNIQSGSVRERGARFLSGELFTVIRP